MSFAEYFSYDIDKDHSMNFVDFKNILEIEFPKFHDHILDETKRKLESIKNNTHMDKFPLEYVFFLRTFAFFDENIHTYYSSKASKFLFKDVPFDYSVLDEGLSFLRKETYEMILLRML